MKTYTKNLSVFMMLLMFITSGINVLAQSEDEIIKQKREVEDFTGIDVGGTFNVILDQSEEQSLFIETKANMHKNISTIVKEGVLYISKKASLRNAKKLNIYVNIPAPDYIKCSGAATVMSSYIKLDKLFVDASGASNLELKLNANEISSEISGASDVKYTGMANIHKLEISGAANLDAGGFETNVSMVNASGASYANVNALKQLEISSSGTANVDYEKAPPEITSNIEHEKKPVIKKETNQIFYASPNEDTINVNVAGVKIKVIEKDGKTEVEVGGNKFDISENRKVNINNVKKKKSRPKFDGHWAGIELGVNGYLTPDYDMNFGEYDYLDLKMSKSIKVGVNLFEQNISLSKNQVFGMTTGLGLEYNNYRLGNNVSLISDSSKILGYLNEGVVISKNKLVATYLNIPILFELQTNKYKKSNSFHFTAGMVFGLRIFTHTKKVYEEFNKNYVMNDPVTGQAVFSATSPGERISKSWDDFHLNPFKMDATVRIGWGWVNLFGTYSISTLFKEGRGPELYPFSVGLTLTDW